MKTDTYKINGYLLFGLVLLLTCSLPVLGHWVQGISLVASFPSALNSQLVYQPVTLLIALVFIWLLKVARPSVFRTYFQKGKIDAPITPVPALFIKPKAGRNWLHEGRDFALVISVVTAIIIYLQVIHGEGIEPAMLWKILPFSLLFSLTNAFVEESITRVGVIVALKGVFSDQMLPFISGAVFGAVHYWGSPVGIAGVLAAGFLGWLLAKSILETKGIFWAWLIHFLQDVIILTALFISK
ncbi:MAG: CPBP family intramembrane glutamic endopeptidase [Cyclobacteriaceae bacterium]